MVRKWLFTAVILVAWIALSRSASSIGLVPGVDPLAIAGYCLTAVMIGALVVLARLAVLSEQGRSSRHGRSDDQRRSVDTGSNDRQGSEER